MSDVRSDGPLEPDAERVNDTAPNMQPSDVNTPGDNASGENVSDERSASAAPTVSMASGDARIVPTGDDLSFSVVRDAPSPGGEQTVLSDSPPFESNRTDDELDAPDTPDGPTGGKTLQEQFFATGRIPIGMTLGHFEITKYIGGGGMGRVYEGIDKALDRKVAIKVLPRQRAQDGAAVARFLNEARSAARLNHEHIAQVYFCGEEGGIPYIAFEYVQGINVRAYVEHNGRMQLAQAVNFLLQIAGALAHAALHGVTHRDVKPSNILITPQGKAKLIDMGLARLLRPSDPQEDLTVSGVTLGTFDYISPEQARDPRLADVRSDIYSLGCTFFFMLTGRPPFPEGTVLQKLLMHQGDDPPDIRSLVAGTPKEVSELIARMMAKDPANRFQTPDELILSLTQIARSIGLRPTGPGKDNWVLTPKAKQKIDYTRHLPWMTAVALLLLSVAAFRFVVRPGDEAAILPQMEQKSQKSALTEPASRDRIDSTNRNAPGLASGNTSAHSSLAPLDQPPVPAAVAPSVPSVSVPENRRFLARLLSPAPRTENSTWALMSEYMVTLSPDRVQDTSNVRAGLGAAPLALSQTLSEPILLNQSPEALRSLRRVISTAAGELFCRWSLAGELMARPIQSDLAANAPKRRVLTVDRVGGKPQTFATLDEALEFAQNDSNQNAGSEREITIELACEGTISCGGLRLHDRSIQLSAKRGFRPRLLFVPKTIPQTAPEAGRDLHALYGANALFSLDGGSLSLSGVEIDFEVPPLSNADESWALFELADSSRLTVNDSVLTIRNVRSDDDFAPICERVAFCRTILAANPTARLAVELSMEKPLEPTSEASEPVAGRGSDLGASDGTAASETLVERAAGTRIEMHRVLAHGEAALCAMESNTVPVAVLFDSFGFCLTGPLVDVLGASKTSVSLDRAVGISYAPILRWKQSALSDTPALNVSVTRSLIRLDEEPFGRMIFSDSLPESNEAPRWLLAESLIFGASAKSRLESRTRTDQSLEYRADPPCFYPAQEGFFEGPVSRTIAPHRFSATDLADALLRPAYKQVKTAAERGTLEAIESGIFSSDSGEL